MCGDINHVISNDDQVTKVLAIWDVRVFTFCFCFVSFSSVYSCQCWTVSDVRHRDGMK